MARRVPIPAPHWSTTPLARVVHPIQEFIHNSAASGIVLMGAAVLALVIANSPLQEEYDALLHAYISVSIGPFELRENVLHWINDGLMAIFFFLVGLEIKREVMVGELSGLRAALLPITAAIGGAVVPAIIYTVLNINRPGGAGWGIPMATDIAFVLGVLAVLGSRAPFVLKVFLTAVAIIDDLLAVLVIAFFYTGNISIADLGSGFALLGLLLLGNLFGIRTTLFYVIVGLLVWVDFLQSGVHATLAGVLIAWTIPVRTRINVPTFLERAGGLLNQLASSVTPGASRYTQMERSALEPTLLLIDETQQSAIIALEDVCEHVQAPPQRLEHALHGWVAFVIIPIFALANAGVALSLDSLMGETTTVALGIVVGLMVGKPLGLISACWLTVRLGIAPLPPGIQWRHIIGVGFLSGIGFTMSLFIASLAFGEAALLEAAKLGILGASLLAGSTGFLLLRGGKPSQQDEPM